MLRRITRLEVMIDALVALGVVGPLAMFDFLLVSRGFDPARTFETLWLLVLSLLLSALLAVRRLAPVPVLIGTLLLAAVHVLVMDQTVYAVWFCVLLPLATIGRWGERSRDFWITGGVILTAAALVSVAAVRVLLGITAEGGLGLQEIVFPAVLTFIPAALLFAGAVMSGVVLRLIVRSNRETRERRQAERSVQVQMELRAAEEERTAIARDMHDVVAHSLAVVVAQANGARYTADSTKKDETLQTIAATARSALTDVRGLLHQLRHSQSADASMGLSDIPEMVQRMREAGLQVELRMDEGLSGSAASQLAAYRIVQEALTNAMRHGRHDAPVPVRVTRAWQQLVIDVHNRPAAFTAGPEQSGHGIQGMRERAALSGGSAWIGLDRGWFRVHARLPLEVQQ